MQVKSKNLKSITRTKERKSTLSIVSEIISNGTSVLLFLFAVVLLCVFIVGRSENASFIGSVCLLTVLSGSMEPAINPGDMIVIKQVGENSLSVGDVITYMAESNDQTLITHRVIEINIASNLVYTQGDANNAPDTGAVFVNNIKGKVILTIPYLGLLISYILLPTHILIGVVIIGILITIKRFVAGNKL